MKTLGLMKVIREGRKYEKMNQADRERLREKKLRELVKSARENSPYYQKLYEDLQESYELKDLPPVNKVELMAHFDEWVTDRNVKLADINKFMENMDNIGRKFVDKYIIYMLIR